MSPVLRLLIFLLAFRLQLMRGQSQNGEMQNSFSGLFAWNQPMSTIATRSMSKNELPRLKEISEVIPRNGFFYGMNPNHRKAMSMVRDLLTASNSTEDFINMAASLRDREEINRHAWLRAVVSESIHRPDMQGLRLPPIVEVMPSLFITSDVLDAVGRSANDTTRNDRCTLIDGDVGNDNGDENRLWYWREDIMVNSFHWQWHLAYPLTFERGEEQDRVGELFYFTHHDLLARYHSERLSVGLPPVKAFNFRKVGTRIPVAYNPHMRDGNSGREWSPRPSGVRVADIDISSEVIHGRPFRISLRNRTLQLNRLRGGIRRGTLIGRNRERINLRSDEGITILGNTFEANSFSVNPEHYGVDGVHNEGHIIISLAQDPRFERRIPPGVMGDTATAMRDVIFYSYHKFVDDVFARYKRTLPAYKLREGRWPLSLEGVNVHRLKVTSVGLPQNVLNTFWSIKRFDLSKGLDFQRAQGEGPLWTCAKHLDHQEFVYELNIERTSIARTASTATVRIFMGPRFDLSGRRYTLEQQRQLMFMMDTFTVPLKYGMNQIFRQSSQTPLTIDFPQSVSELGASPENTRPFCGCGWPRHLLIPKGTPEGLSMDVFAIVTDSKEDSVAQDGGSASESNMGCRPAYLYCGLMDRKYPHASPMSFPFDRKLYLSEERSGHVILDDLVREIPNSGHARVSIVHRNELRNFGTGFRSSVLSSVESPEDFQIDDNDGNDTSSASSSAEYSDSDES